MRKRLGKAGLFDMIRNALLDSTANSGLAHFRVLQKLPEFVQLRLESSQ